MRLLWKAISLVSVGFLFIMIAGYVASLWLPSGGLNYGSTCFWTDAMFVFVRCGENAPFGETREAFYNLHFFVLLLISAFFKHKPELLPMAIAAWSAIIIAVVVIVRFFYSRLRWPK
ncbi:hypothetical protein JJJ17_09835 [Paracoccus caeni]|uniref:Uncharacterized protein n=1 Tax=Paracoccus caeni TaxID=657651 RepID=A0A934W0X6_9RHOB|nr:hypothetical protein [Paracoccus caeni]MBK4216224.1 hypothetical protein [Paracoccus caeni]